MKLSEEKQLYVVGGVTIVAVALFGLGVEIESPRMAVFSVALALGVVSWTLYRANNP